MKILEKIQKNWDKKATTEALTKNMRSSGSTHIASAAPGAGSCCLHHIRSTTYDYDNVSAAEMIITFSIILCPVKSLWSSTSL
jgi:hypothetical protein